MPAQNPLIFILSLSLAIPLTGCGSSAKKETPPKAAVRTHTVKKKASIATTTPNVVASSAANDTSHSQTTAPLTRTNSEPAPGAKPPAPTITPAPAAPPQTPVSEPAPAAKPVATEPAPAAKSVATEPPPAAKSVATEPAPAAKPAANESPEAPKTLNLVIERYSEESEFTQLVPGKPGTLLFADGRKIGSLGTTSPWTLTIPATTKTILVVVSRSEAEAYQAPFRRDANKQTKWKTKDSLEEGVDADLVMDDSDEGVLGHQRTQLHFKFLDGHDQLKKMAQLFSVDPASPKNTPAKSFATLNSEFKVTADGKIAALSVAKIRDLLLRQPQQEMTFEIHGLGIDGKHYFGQVKVKAQ